MANVFRFFSALLEKITNFASWLLAVFKQVFIDLWSMATDAVCWVFEGLLGIAVSVIELVDVPFDPATYYALIPADLGNMLGVIGFTQAMTMIVAALVIRFVLQTVPFVRWGS